MFYVSLVVGVIVLVYICAQIATRYGQDYFIFLPQKLEKNYRFRFPFPFDEIWIKTPSGGEINGLWLKRAESKGLILYFHGNAGSLKRWGRICHKLLFFPYDVIVTDYRGYGKSTGEKNESIFYQDAMSVYEYALQHYTQENIIIYGRSIGSAPASYVASQTQTPLLILETPFFSMPALFLSYYKIVPPQLFSFKYNFRNDLYLQAVKAPILIFHGTKDRVVPYSHAVKLKELLGDKANLCTFEGATHHNCMSYEHYWLEIQKMLKQIPS